MGTIIGDGITFDDVLLVPRVFEVTPNMVGLSSRLTKKVKLNIPMMSAGMEQLPNIVWRLPWQDREVLVSFTKTCLSRRRLMRWTR